MKFKTYIMYYKKVLAFPTSENIDTRYLDKFFEENGYICSLRAHSSDSFPCLKGKITIEDLVLLFNRILPIVFASRSNDMSNVASALMKYSRYELSVKDFIKSHHEENK